MHLIHKPLKQQLRSNDPLHGIFIGFADTYAAEICAGAGFDWVLIDAEHTIFDLRTILHHLQAIAAHQVPAIVRPPSSDPVFIKQLLDAGVQTLLIPMVETAEEARMLVKAMRYPPEGIRGVGAGLARAAQWNRTPDYMKQANQEMCLIVQVESVKGLENLEEIVKVEGVDSVFIGPADLAASMGYVGEMHHPKVMATIDDALKSIRAHGKAAGVLALDAETIERYTAAGANLIAVGSDVVMLAAATERLARSLKTG